MGGIETVVTKAKDKLRDLALRAVGVSGLNQVGGYIYEEFHKNLRGKKAIKVFRQMHDNNAICGAVSYAMEAQVVQTPLNVVANEKAEPVEAERQRVHVEQCLADMRSTPEQTLSEILSLIWAGYSYHETVYKFRRGQTAMPEFQSRHNDGAIGWREFAPRAQETIDHWQFDDHGDLLGAWQFAPPKYRYDYLPLEKCLLFRSKCTKGNPEGRSLYRPAYRSWFFLTRIEELEAIGIERDMAGMLVFRLPPEFFLSDGTENQKATLERYRKMAERARRGEYEGLVFPSSKDEQGETGWDLSLLQSGGRRPIDTNEINKRLESRIAITMLGEAALLGMQGQPGASRNLGEVKTALSQLALKAIMDGTAAEFNRVAIPRLIDVNNWPIEAAPCVQFADIENVVDLTTLPPLAVGGLLTPGPRVETYIRRRLGIDDEEMPSLGQVQDAVGELAEREEKLDSDGPPDAVAQSLIPIAEQQGTPSAAMTPEEAADYLNTTRSSIMGAIRRGQLPGAKIGNSYRIMRTDLDTYMRGEKRARKTERVIKHIRNWLGASGQA